MAAARTTRISRPGGGAAAAAAAVAVLVVSALAARTEYSWQEGGDDPAATACARRPVVFAFGDSNTDTGGVAAGLGYYYPLPEGRAFFRRATGRLCDGRLVIDYLCESSSSHTSSSPISTAASFLILHCSSPAGRSRARTQLASGGRGRREGSQRTIERRLLVCGA